MNPVLSRDKSKAFARIFSGAVGCMAVHFDQLTLRFQKSETAYTLLCDGPAKIDDRRRAGHVCWCNVFGVRIF